jgi:hypothetical protein
VRDGKLYFFMYEVPRNKFLEGNVDARIETGIEIWKSFTGDEPDAYVNTGCYWWDDLCGHSGDECVDGTTVA